MQTSHVFNQVRWPLAGDTDDCWVVATIQAVNAVAPWLNLPSVRAFREAAGDPDNGVRDGGNVTEIMDGIRGTWPAIAGSIKSIRQQPWATLVSHLTAGRPVSVAVKSSLLPARLQYGFGGAHQICIVRKGVRFLLANPLAPVYSSWDVVTLDELRAAIMGYGELRTGQRSVFGVAMPTEAEAFRLHPMFKGEVEAAARAAAGPLLEQATLQGYASAREKAIAAVSAI
jgi:NAD-dependent oxidoreductase involved in siderophore biosynthesis